MARATTSQRRQEWSDTDMTQRSGPEQVHDTEVLAGAGVLPRPELLRDPDHRAHKAALAAQLFGGPLAVERVGRFRIAERLGEGGMGVVYAAHDEELGRPVAIKLLHAGVDAGEGRPRLLREAQALARLSHPNVVQLFEVGEHQGRLFVAMEQVRGQTLHAWMHRAGQPRPWREVLAVFMAAGRGLAAAHAVGLVHRDFKPSNVMVGDDGGVRVLDFGLARAGLQAAEVEVPVSAEAASLSLLATPMTQTGGLVGTPAYMAPEQFHGRSSDPRGDQFSFCVALFEALYGMRPFAGATLAELLAAIDRGAIARPPSGTRVPGWLYAALARGLARDPGRRWPDMAALLGELGRDRQARGRRLAIVGVIAGLAMLPIGMGVDAGLTALAEQRQLAACELRGDEVAAVWTPAARERLAARASGVSAKQRVAVTDALERIDWRANRWREKRIGGCMARPEGYLHPAHMAERVARMDGCFAEELDDLGSMIALFERAPVDELAGIDRIGVFGVHRCVGEPWLTETTPNYPESPAARRHWQSVYTEILAAELAMVAGRPGAAEATLPAAVQAAGELPSPRVAAEGLRALIGAQFAAGHRRQAFAALASERARTQEFIGESSFDLFDTVERNLLLGSVSGEPLHSAALLASGRDRGGSYSGAEFLQAALKEGRRPFWRKDWPRVDSWLGRGMGWTTAVMAAMQAGVGDFEAAEEHARMGLVIAAGRPDEPGLVVELLLALGTARRGLGHYALAEAALRDALARVLRDDMGGRSREGMVRLALAELRLARGDADGAARELAAAVEIAAEADRDDDRFAPTLLMLEGRLHGLNGDLEGAAARLRRARAALADSHGATRGLLISCESELARVALAAGRLADAEEPLRAALKHNAALVGEEHVSNARILALRARVQQAQGDVVGAESSRGRARAVIAGQAVAPELRAELRE